MTRTDFDRPGIYNSSPLTLSSGEGSALATDSEGKVVLSGSSSKNASDYTSNAYKNSEVIKSSGGILYELFVHNSLGSAQWIQVHNTTALPADAAVPVAIFKIPANSSASRVFEGGKVLSTGITVCNSTTGPTKTLGAADCWFEAKYE